MSQSQTDEHLNPMRFPAEIRAKMEWIHKQCSFLEDDGENSANYYDGAWVALKWVLKELEVI